MNIVHIAKNFKVVAGLLPWRDRKRLIIASIVIAISSILEVAVISTVYPFLLFAFKGETANSDIPFLSVGNSRLLTDSSLLELSFIYLSFVLFSMFFKIFVWKKTGYYISVSANNLASKVFERTLFGNYNNTSSQEVVSNIILRCNYVMGAFVNVSNMFSSLIIILGIGYTLTNVNAMVTIVGISTVIAFYGSILWFVSNKSMKNSKIIDGQSVMQINHAKQSLGNIKNIIIESRIEKEVLIFNGIDLSIRLARLSNQLINMIPRAIIETLIVFFIVISVIFLSKTSTEIENFLPLVGLYVISFQKALPSVNALYTNYMNILQAGESLFKLASQIQSIGFDVGIEKRAINVKKIDVLNVGHRNRESGEMMYMPLNKEIYRGDKYIINGPSGIGKSTLLEAIIGLNVPDRGDVFVNGEILNEDIIKVWWNSITYVPQSPYVFDSSLFDNITMMSDDEEFDEKQYRKVYSTVRLGYECNIEKHKKLEIKENGNNLSGGEKQRLLLARALYKKKDVLFLDESLSALDSYLRKQILLDLIENYPELTVVYISHNSEDSDIFNKNITLEPSLI